IVNSEILLNDMNVDVLNFKKFGEATESDSSTQKIGKEVVQSFGGSEEGDSDRTVTQEISTGGERVIGSNGTLTGPLHMRKSLSSKIGRYVEGGKLGLDNLSPIETSHGLGARESVATKEGGGKSVGPVLGWRVAGRVAMTRGRPKRVESERVAKTPDA
ncbi:hypothetical protein S83_042468, partial [Arachis hypogaea]